LLDRNYGIKERNCQAIYRDTLERPNPGRRTIASILLKYLISRMEKEFKVVLLWPINITLLIYWGTNSVLIDECSLKMVFRLRLILLFVGSYMVKKEMNEQW